MDAPRFCATPDPLPHLAILGVLSAEDNTEFRRALRASWMQVGHTTLGGDGTDIQVRFVMRGLGVRSATVEEGQIHGDTVFVRARSELGRSSGPLMSLLLWLRCAHVAWPAASLIGKADDDVWADLPRIALIMQRSLEALDANGTRQPRVLVGHLEGYSWDEAAHRPTLWGGAGWFQMGACEASRVKRREKLVQRSLRGVGLAEGGEDAVLPQVPVTGPFPFPVRNARTRTTLVIPPAFD